MVYARFASSVVVPSTVPSEIPVFISDNKIEEILHCILAHHCEKEWGSPVKPKTKEAWIVHLADQTSARCLGGEI